MEPELYSFSVEEKSRLEQLERELENGFFILAGARTGSTWLQTSLDQHPNLWCRTEIFPYNPKEDIRKLQNSAEVITRLEETFLSKKKPLKAFKILEYQWQAYPELRAILMRNSAKVKCITLVRENLLDWYISNVVSFRVKKYYGGFANVKLGDDHLLDEIRQPFFLEPEKVKWGINYLAEVRKNVLISASSFAQSKNLTYESLLKDFSSELKSTFSFLGLTPIESQNRTLKIIDQPKKIVTNYTELEAEFSGAHTMGSLQ